MPLAATLPLGVSCHNNKAASMSGVIPFTAGHPRLAKVATAFGNDTGQPVFFVFIFSRPAVRCVCCFSADSGIKENFANLVHV